MYAYTMDVNQTVEMYDKVHAELERQLGRSHPPGCLMHLATRIDTGFRITEVWESHEAADRFGDEVMRPLIGRVVGEQAMAQGPPASEELRVIRLDVDERALTSA